MTQLAMYLVLEDVMLKLDAMDEEALADRVRDVMDALWQELTDAEHEQLDARTQEEGETP